MAIDWSELKSAEDVDPPIVTLYAGAKSGKTTLASEFPDPYYCRTGDGERAPKGVVMPSFGVSDSYQDVVDQIEWMIEAEHDRRTFILDTLDGLELHIRKEACRRNNWADIEEPGFGKGYAAELSIWHEFVQLCLRCKRAGYYVVLVAHIKAKTVPGVTTDSYPLTRHSATLAADMTTTNLDLVVTTQDLFDYLAEFFGASLYGDYNKDGSVTVQDLFSYLDAYFSAQSL